MKLVIADTGPVLHLYQAEALHLLGHFNEVVIVPTVMLELKRHAPDLWKDGLPP